MEYLDNKILFAEKGIKNTKQRNMTYNILIQENLPVTAELIFLKIKALDEKISLSTVYRILEVFISKGLVIKRNLSEDNMAVFEINNMEHKHHLICYCCKKMQVIKGCPLGAYEKILQKETDYDISGHRLEIYGYCPDCKEKM
ncbi:MAG: transcriptional repressor [Firmicutes bacterium HGW-Firmicutes-3]|jgi:Fur family ferric uptake transcriptional regulator|nr:MAG: transcriptional repressor [Firmicutes bacterium HGW-Firmicutes-3]